MLAPAPYLDSYITYGGYDNQSYSENDTIIGHPISGSFHWQVHIVNIVYNGTNIKPSVTTGLTDTGTTLFFVR